MNHIGKEQNSKFLFHKTNIKKQKFFFQTDNKNKNSNSIISSIKGNGLELNKATSIKRSITNYGKKISKENENKGCSTSIVNKQPRSKKRKSLKYIEKTIMNKLLDISIQIEKEENFTSDINNKENLKLSTFIKKQIELDNDNSFISKEKTSNRLRLKNSSNPNTKLDLSESSVYSKKSFLSKKNSSPQIQKPKGKDKYRILVQKNILYDSFDSDEDKENENESFNISPKSNFILIFDFLILIFSFIDIIYTPFRLSIINGFCDQPNNFIMYIYYCIDILYIVDMLLGFVRSYYNFQFEIINNKKRIVKHYIVTQFWFDFFEAIPVFSFILYLCKRSHNINCDAYDLNNKQMFLLLFCFIKQVKLFKIINIKNNSITFVFNDFISENENIEKVVNFLIIVGICSFCFYSFISIHIFIGRHSYPNWIIRGGFQNKSHILLYLTSFYYLITTMTTVGYGDIVSVAFSEIIFQIILLSVGITVYSWVVSNIGNYVKNESYASMQFNKDGTILEEIRISHPNMPFRLYKQILQHLNARKIRQQQCDSNLLINSLPYSLKNTVLLTMYKHTINHFKIFKGCQNSDFKVRILTSFIPLFTKKNAILIHEGQQVDNIIFVKNGRLSLQAAIDKDEPEESITQYLNKNFGNISDDLMFLSNYESSNSSSSSSSKIKKYQTHLDLAKTALDTAINKKLKTVLESDMNESGIGKEMGKWEFGGEDFEESNYHFLNIINISKNESYGVVYMFLDRPSPLSLRVKSKKAEILLLRKNDATDISLRYPNIWMKYFKKSYFNSFSIKNITLNKIQHFWENLEKKSKQNNQALHRAKTNLNLCTIYKLNDKEVNEITKMINDPNKKNVTIQRAKTHGRKKTNGNNINRFFNMNNSKKSNLSTTNYSGINSFSFGSVAKKNEEKKSVINKSKFAENSSTMEKDNNLKFISKSSKNQTSIANSQTKKGNPRSFRKSNINKLKIEIKKLKNSKKYYKNLCEELSISKGIDSNLLSKNYKSALFSSLDKNNNITFGVNGKGEQNINIYNNLNHNIINNITIKNNGSQFFKSINNQSYSNDSYSSNSETTQRRFNFNEITIKSEIKLYFKSKYINLEKFTSGEFSKNEELQKQSLNFIKVFLEIKKKKKSKKLNSKKNKEKRNSGFTKNNDFRYFLNKFNSNYQNNNFPLKREKLINNKYINNNSSENSANEIINKLKNTYMKKRKSIQAKKSNNIKINKYYNFSLSPAKAMTRSQLSCKEKEGFFKNRKGSNFNLKLPSKVKINNENEEEIIFNKSNECITSKINSINNEDTKKESLLESMKKVSTDKSKSSLNFKLESCNEQTSN